MHIHKSLSHRKLGESQWGGGQGTYSFIHLQKYRQIQIFACFISPRETFLPVN